MSTSNTESLPKTYRAGEYEAFFFVRLKFTTNALPVSCPGPGKGWETIDVPVRPPGPHEVFIKVLAAGLCGSDHFVEDGSWPGLKYPLTAGHENIGRIVSVGSAVSNLAGRLNPGTLVGVGWSGGYCGTCAVCREGDFAGCETAQYTGFSFHGGHGEYMYAPETGKLYLTLDLSRTESFIRGIGPAVLCWRDCVRGDTNKQLETRRPMHRSRNRWTRSPRNPGKLPLTIATTPAIECYFLKSQYASKLGLRVYTVSSSSSKAELAKSLGATGHIDTSATPDLVEHIRSLSPAGDGAKLILCTAPYAKQISAILPAVGRNGTITLVSAATDGNIKVANLMLNMKRATLRGWSCGGGYETDECIRFSILAGVKSMVKTFSLDEFPKAYDDLIHGQPKFRNVITFPE